VLYLVDGASATHKRMFVEGNGDSLKYGAEAFVLFLLGAKVRSHRYICLWGASEGKLGKSLKPNQKKR